MEDCNEINRIKSTKLKKTIKQTKGELAKDKIRSVSSVHTKIIEEYNFFVGHNVSPHSHKHSEEEHQPKTALDIIHSELADMGIPISATVVVMPVIKDGDYFVNPIKSSAGTDWKEKIFRKMKERLNKENCASDWFDETGETIFYLTTLSPKGRMESMLRNNSLQVAYVPPYMNSSKFTTKETLKFDDVKLIDMEFRTFRFKHHHYFSLEHILSECLKEYYIHYSNQIANNILQNLDDELNTNRHAREKVKIELLKLQISREEIQLDPTVLKYNKRIEEIKERYSVEVERNEELIKIIILLWKDIKWVRKKTSTVNTPLVLEVIEENISQEEISEIWNKKYELELMDVLDNIESKYAYELQHYKKQNHIHEGVEKKSRKPMKPRLDLDEDEIRKQVEHKLNHQVLKGPRISLNLKNEENFIRAHASNPLETERRMKMDQTIYYFRIYVDQYIVCETTHFTLNHDFSIDTSESLSIQLLPSNEIITIMLIENEKPLSKIKIEIKHVETNFVQEKYFKTKEKLEAKGYCVGSGITLQELGAAQNIELETTEIIKNKFYTSGQFNLMLAWDDRDKESHTRNIKIYKDTLQKTNNFLSFNRKLDMNLLNEIIIKVSQTPEELDMNLKIFNELKPRIEEKYLCGNSNELIFVPQTGADSSRLKLLAIRNNGNLGDSEQTIIPLYSSQLSTEQIQILDDNPVFDKHNLFDDQHALGTEPLDLQRYLGAKYIDNLNKHIMKKIKENMLKPTYTNMVINNNQFWDPWRILSRLGGLSFEAATRGSNMCKHSTLQDLHVSIFRAFCLPDRLNQDSLGRNTSHEDEGFTVNQLRPFIRASYKDRSEQTKTAIGCNPTWNQTLHLSIRSREPQVLNINVYDELKEDLTDDDDDLESNQNNVHYRRSHKWLGSLQIPILAVQSLPKMQGALKINTPPVILGYQSSTDTKTNKNLLHSFYDPVLPTQKDSAFITLSISTQPQLTTSINTNTMANLYSPDEEHLFGHLRIFFANHAKEFPHRKFLLTYFGTNGSRVCVVNFLQALPLPNLELLQKDLRANMRGESALSKSSSSSQARSKDGRRSGTEERGDSANTLRSSEFWTTERDTFEMRSLKTESNQLDRIISTCARYVSLIPLYEASQLYEVTLMPWELLKVLHGSPLDHTILLASYFLCLGIRCWVVTGMGLPRGLSSYLLVKYDLETERILLTAEDADNKPRSFYTMTRDTVVPFIYDAVTGSRYDLRDACCPLKTVHYVYNDENIWINVQLVESSESVRLDFTRTSEWQPVFNKNTRISKMTPPSEHSLYSEPEIVDSLKRRIENKIKTKVQKWRSNKRTIWNRYCSSVLKESLPQWEYWSFNPTTPKPGPNNRLKQLLSTYKIFGFPLNLSYTNMKKLLSSIKSTGLFLNEEPSVEFGLAVEIFSYPGAVLSVWLYLASITRN